MAVLKLSAVNPDAGSLVSKESLRKRFNYVSFSGTCRTKEQGVASGPIGITEACLMCFKDVYKSLCGFLLPNYLVGELLAQ
jgi:hypothetical protein